MSAPILVWFRNDLRLTDHPALHQAEKKGVPVICLYVFDDEASGLWSMGTASRWWLHHSLIALRTDLRQLGSDLILRSGNTTEILIDIAVQTRVEEIYCSKQFEPRASAIERGLRQSLENKNITLHCFPGQLLHSPERLCTKIRKPYKVYTPFWRALTAAEIRTPKPAPTKLLMPEISLKSETVEDWNLLSNVSDWTEKLYEIWKPGEKSARQRLKAFIENSAATYHLDRDQPRQPNAVPGTSKLSPHLHFGEISPAECWHAASLKVVQNLAESKGLETFRKELAWRDFSYHLLHHTPSLPTQPFREQFVNFPWRAQSEIRDVQLKAWQNGNTGYPIVDAGMRELRTTGWMHNRVRMVVASFLTKHLLIPWQLGQAWFWDHLVDADLASNTAGWQWVSGCGADAAPYFRIFNPITQGQKFDPNGEYVRFWVPEIRIVPNKFIHTPWLCPEDILNVHEVKIGSTYPKPIVDHKQARIEALNAYKKIKSISH
ncbi:MAG: Deoxyribodipyrimidine photo-lyase [Hyphomicrobiaceae bacterium hypho_1]